MQYASKILELVELIYAAAVDAQHWPVFLDALAEILDAGPTSLVSFTDIDVTPRAVLSATVRIDDASAIRYDNDFSVKDPFAIKGKHLLVAGTVMSGQMILTDRELENTDFYQDLMRPLGVFHQAAVTIEHNESSTAALTTVRSRGAGPYGHAELSLLTAILPHLRQGLRLGTKLSRLQLRVDSLGSVLDKLPIAVVLVDRLGNILSLNGEAELILAQGDGLSRERNTVRAGIRSQQVQLQKLVHCASRSRVESGTPAGGAMLVSRPSLRRAYSVLVAPCPRQLSATPENVQTAVIFISDPDAGFQPDHQVLRELFGFTAAQSRVAAFLMRGKSLSEAAEHFGVTRNTLRSQLAELLGKTGTHRQGEFIQLLSSSVASLRCETRKVPGQHRSLTADKFK